MNKGNIVKRLNEINSALTFLNECYHKDEVVSFDFVEYRTCLFLRVSMVKAGLLVERECLEEELKEMLNEELKDE